jgi:hypothetical protein
MTGPRKTVAKAEPDEFIEPEAPEAVAVSAEPTEDEIAEADAEDLPYWYPGRPCPHCGAVSGVYKWTTLAGCSACLLEDETATEEG